MNKETLLELLKIPLSDLTEENKTELTEYYKLINSTEICETCPDMFSEHYQDLIDNGVAFFNNIEKVNKETKTIETNSFKLRSDLGYTPIDLGDNTYLSQSHTPNDVCISFLKTNPNRIEMFVIYPENWIELIK